MQTLSNWENKKTSIWCSWKQAIKELKFLEQISVGCAFTLPKRIHRKEMFGTQSGYGQNPNFYQKGLRTFTPVKPRLDVHTASQDWKPELEETIKHDDLYARAMKSQVLISIKINRNYLTDVIQLLKLIRRMPKHVQPLAEHHRHFLKQTGYMMEQIWMTT